VARRHCELDSKIHKPAEAEKYRCEAMAEANKQKTLCEAHGMAEAIAMKGDADAFAIEVKAKAESESMAMKADAWKEYRKAAKISMWLEAMPSIAAEVAAPLSQTNKITMVGFPDQNESLGPARLTNEVLNIIDSIPEAMTQMTGYKIKNPSL
jgi:flotillin